MQADLQLRKSRANQIFSTYKFFNTKLKFLNTLDYPSILHLSLFGLNILTLISRTFVAKTSNQNKSVAKPSMFSSDLV